jgi:hypothetical protein
MTINQIGIVAVDNPEQLPECVESHGVLSIADVWNRFVVTFIFL